MNNKNKLRYISKLIIVLEKKHLDILDRKWEWKLCEHFVWYVTNYYLYTIIKNR